MQNPKGLNKIDKLGYVLVSVFLILCILILLLLITTKFFPKLFNKEILSGASVAIFSFFLAVGWDEYKNRREIKRREGIIISAVEDELRRNQQILAENKKILESDLIARDESKGVVIPLQYLYEGFWELSRMNLPRKFIEKDYLVKMQKLATLTNYFNEMIRSRESYRIQNEAMTNFSGRMKIYDKSLLDKVAELEILLDEPLVKKSTGG